MGNNMRYMISDAANIVKVESHVLRYWEDELELDIPRNEMGHRYYTEENIKQFQQIKAWKEQGYQLKAIRMLVHSEKMQTADRTETEYRQSTDDKEQKFMKAERGDAMAQKQATNTGLIASSGKKQSETVKNSASNTIKLEQFQSMMANIVKAAIEENNLALSRDVGDHVGEKVLKEMNYLMREQDEVDEERFRKLDAAIRTYRKGKKVKEEKEEKSGRFFHKNKKLNPNLNI
ncbi:MerR family transcriptional regulator [Lachnospiraceae bacterium ZAX-1]